MSNFDAPPNSVGWHILEGYPWWPVYICDATKLRPNLHLLGSGHKGILRKAKEFPKDFGLVYFFGSHDFGPVRLKKGLTLKPWDCAEKDKLLKGMPSHLVKKKGQLDELKVAIQEAEDYLSTPEDIRLPPCMVPSDLDPTLDPPPPIERDELMDEDDDEDDDAAGDADGGHASEGDDDDAMSDGSDHESRKSKEKTKKKKEKKASSKDKKASSKSSSKDKKAASKSKKESSKDKEKKSSKKDKSGAGDDKKRKKTSSDEPATGDAAAKTPPSKVAKKDKAADVKSEGAAAAAPASASSSSATTAAPSAKSSKSSKSKSADAANQLSGEALSAVLEKEIKWILANCQFEEMTTKTVRKLLEKRLSMDLRHHKASIKEGVARVIASMEDGTDVPGAGEADGDAAVKAEAPAAAAASEPAEAAPIERNAEDAPAAAGSASPAPVKDEPMQSDAAEPATEDSSESSQQQQQPAAREDAVAQHLSDAERELGLALNEEPKLVAALQTLQQNVPSVEKSTLVSASALVAKLVALRAHEEASVSKLVAALAQQWDADDVIPAPKPIREGDILEMKEKLENAETSHEDMLACLSELAKMRLQMSHLKNTGIARVVANLRQHANDKVSIAAINLRKSWIQLTKSKTDSKSDADRVKTLESMNRILEQKSSEGESSHLAVLEKLQGMTLSTQDIIKSKIGVVVSKLRKSSNEKVAKAATLLRKKWKAEAAA